MQNPLVIFTWRRGDERRERECVKERKRQTERQRMVIEAFLDGRALIEPRLSTEGDGDVKGK